MTKRVLSVGPRTPLKEVAKLLRRFVERVSGVVGVRSQLTWAARN